MSSGQKAIFEDIVRGPRGEITGPFEAWLRSPEFASRAQRLGEFCRYRTSLPLALTELAILIVAAHHRAQLEWHVHAPIAVRAGISASAVEKIRIGDAPELKHPDQVLVAILVDSLVRTSRISDDVFSDALAHFGETALVELVGLVGYYTLVALTLNAFEAPLPPGAPLPFPDA